MLTREELKSEIERQQLKSGTSKNEMKQKLSSHLQLTTVLPEPGMRIEVYFPEGVKGWYRGTYEVDKKKDVIIFDDGDEQIIENWGIIKWRIAKNCRRAKNKIK
jgi:hypothetical protein